MLQELALGAVTKYVRHSPVQIAKWRLALKTVQWVRRFGPQMGSRTVRTKYGFRMRLNLADWVDQHIFATGDYEPEVIEVAKHSIAPGNTVIDIGANVGFFSLLFSTLVGRNGKVTSFEPQPSAVTRLNENVRLNQHLQVNVHQLAASDVTGTLSFYCGPEDHSGVASLRSIDHFSRRIDVNTAPLDEIIPAQQQVHLIKIDVEGAEAKVIAGATRTIGMWRPDIVVEVSNSYLKQMGSSGAELCEAFFQFGYSMYHIDWKGLRNCPVWTESLPDQFNALFTVLPEKFSSMVL